MNVLVTGANGQLGNEMRIVLGNHHEHSALFTDIEELDLTQRARCKDKENYPNLVSFIDHESDF